MIYIKIQSFSRFTFCGLIDMKIQSFSFTILVDLHQFQGFSRFTFGGLIYIKIQSFSFAICGLMKRIKIPRILDVNAKYFDLTVIYEKGYIFPFYG